MKKVIRILGYQGAGYQSFSGSGNGYQVGSLALVSFVLLVSCFLLRDVLAKEKKIHPRELFNHEMHTEIFTGSNVPCETCHINEQYEWKGMNLLGCHKCHNSPKPLVMATQDCSMCHASFPVKPANHKINWTAQHKTEAKANPSYCKNCHNDRFCIKCHEQRSTIKQNVHKRNFRYFHSVEARADPKKCDRCHVVAFCTSCHTNPRGR